MKGDDTETGKTKIREEQYQQDQLTLEYLIAVF